MSTGDRKRQIVSQMQIENFRHQDKDLVLMYDYIKQNYLEIQLKSPFIVLRLYVF